MKALNLTAIAPRAWHASCVALITFTGCAHSPLRLHTSELDLISALDAPAGVTAPMAVRTVAPKYPYQMAFLGWEGDVWVSCLVDEQGAVHEARALETSPDNFMFAEAAESALKQWSFAPATRNGRSVAIRIIVPFQFAFPSGDHAARQ